VIRVRYHHICLSRFVTVSVVHLALSDAEASGQELLEYRASIGLDIVAFVAWMGRLRSRFIEGQPEGLLGCLQHPMKAQMRFGQAVISHNLEGTGQAPLRVQT
jgi:hypothetical protein